MGTRFAPSFANLYMGRFEKIFIYENHPWLSNIVTYKRYIDDLLIIWNGTSEEITSFTKHLNDNKWGLNFTSNHSTTKIEILDLELSNNNHTIIKKNFFF